MTTLKKIDRHPKIFHLLTGFSVVFCALLFNASLIPGVTDFAPLNSYGWRIAMVILIFTVSISRRGIYFSKRYTAIFFPFLIVAWILSAYHHGAQIDIAVKNSLMVLLIAAITPGATDDPAKPIIRKFMRTSLLVAIVLTFFFTVRELVPDWSWENSRMKKAQLLDVIPYNTVLFLVAVGIVVNSFQENKFYLFHFALLFLLSVLATTRTPVATLMFATAIGWALWSVRISSFQISLCLAMAIILSVIFASIFVGIYPNAELNRFLAGRQALWGAGVFQWLSHPVLGDPTISTSNAMLLAYSDLSFLYFWEVEALLQMTSGGFHNIWIEILASRGLLGLAPVLIAYFYLVTLALRFKNPIFIIFLLLIIFRSSFEMGGVLFSTASSALDFFVYLAVAVLLSCDKEGTSDQQHRRRRGV